MTTVLLTAQELLNKTYKYTSSEQNARSEASFGYQVRELEVNNGIFIHVEGMEYPEKGMVSTRDISIVNVSKKLIIETMRLAPLLSPLLLIFLVLPWSKKTKIINRILSWHNNISMRNMETVILQDHMLTPMAQELNILLLDFMFNLGLDHKISNVFCEILANIINFDNAYRYRLQDLANETTSELLQNPRKEIKRLLLINREREIQHGHMVSHKFKLFANIISLAMLHPKVKKAFLKTAEIVVWDKLRPDEADKFWMCIRTGYNYFGKTDKERTMLINHLKYVIPSKIMI